MLDLSMSDLNIWAIVVCAVVALVSGSLWYNPKTFFFVWWKAIGKTEKDKPGSDSMGTVFALTTLSSFVQPLLLAIILSLLFPEGASAWLGVQTGFLLWIGFIAPTYLVNKLFAGHGLKAWAIETGNHLLNMLLFGLIIGAWQ